jgi:hypothetical protein
VLVGGVADVVFAEVVLVEEDEDDFLVAVFLGLVDRGIIVYISIVFLSYFIVNIFNYYN